MDSNLKFGTNWRRILLLQKSASIDADVPVQYIKLDEARLPCKLGRFCSDNWEDYGFDYDTYSFLLWSLDDSRSAKDVVSALNKKYPKCASVIIKTPAEAHGLEFTDLTFDE